MNQDWNSFYKQLRQSPKFREEYKRLASEPEFAIYDVLEKLAKSPLSQSEIAKKMNTTQSAIARFKSGKVNPTLKFLHRLAMALDMRLEVKFKPII